MKYLHIKLLENIKKEMIILKIGDEELKISPTPGKWLTNIPLNGALFSVLKGDVDQIILEASDNKIFHPDQDLFDAKYSIKTHNFLGVETFYSSMGNLVDPEYILVTFPGVSNFDNVNYRLSALTSIQHRLAANTFILAFQDKEAVYGNYMFNASTGDLIKPAVISLIKGISSKFRVPEEKIIFYGNSKGGSIAIDYINEFEKSNFFIDIPQLDLFNYKSQNDIMRFSLGVEARNHNFFKNNFPLIRRDNVVYSFAENDFDASRGLPMKEFSGLKVNMLKDMGHSNAAMEFVKRQFSKIFQIVNGVEVSVRPSISCIAYIKDNFLFLNRYLSAFNSEELAKNLYAEINFRGKTNTYSVSLNKKFIKDKTFVYWGKGFDFGKHLDDDLYDMSLTVYTKYKEVKYPLKLKLFVNGGNSSLKTI